MKDLRNYWSGYTYTAFSAPVELDGSNYALPGKVHRMEASCFDYLDKPCRLRFLTHEGKISEVIVCLDKEGLLHLTNLVLRLLETQPVSSTEYMALLEQLNKLSSTPND